MLIAKNDNTSTDNLLTNIEESILKKQLQELCLELDAKNKKILYLENRNSELQEAQSKIM